MLTAKIPQRQTIHMFLGAPEQDPKFKSKIVERGKQIYYHWLSRHGTVTVVKGVTGGGR
jgi:hypothetical protein